jgi:Fe-S cluster assembly ATP-binding protein
LAELEIRNLHVRTEDREILRGVDLTVRSGELHALLGPNGSGKSTLANTIMGHPGYEVTEGQILFDGEELRELAPHERARLGLFLAFQYPVAVPGVSVANQGQGVRRSAGPRRQAARRRSLVHLAPPQRRLLGR